MNKEELKLYVKKSCENILKQLAENPKEMLNLLELQDKYNNLLKEKIELKRQIKKQKEVIDKVAEYIEKHIKYECDDSYNGMQFYSYHLYDFNKQDLLDILKEGKK